MKDVNEAAALVFPAPAKLNLFLHVTGQRPNGYHDIQTLFQLIDLADDVRIRVTATGEIVRIAGNYPVPPELDLVVRAARLLQRASGTRAGAMIGVNKRIPIGSGLGGGSSDAATVLLALNYLWDTGFSISDLAPLAATLGADVPVFVHGHSALAQGIGEKLEPVQLGQRHYVVVFPPFPISTAEVFHHPELARDSEPLTLVEALAGSGRNDCQPVAAKLHPELAAVFEALQSWGSPRLTGTGSGIFLEMPDEKTAITTAQGIKCRYNVRAVQGHDRSPMHALLDQLS